ncbi:MAG: hypothetical protein ISQ21_03795 [Alphaproteobacteria bacterium]|nr:hypothetical protein [Alphaproteobacteria bacterium]
MITFYVLNLDPMVAEIGQTACAYFHNRVIAPDQQPKLKVDFGLVNDPTELDPSIRLNLPNADALSAVKSTSLFKKGVPQPRQDFRLILSRRTKLENTIESLADIWIHIASLSTGRLMLTQEPKSKAPIIAWWLGKKLAPIDDIPMAERPWEKDKAELSPQLADEFISRFMKDQT